MRPGEAALAGDDDVRPTRRTAAATTRAIAARSTASRAESQIRTAVVAPRPEAQASTLPGSGGPTVRVTTWFVRARAHSRAARSARAVTTSRSPPRCPTAPPSAPPPSELEVGRHVEPLVREDQRDHDGPARPPPLAAPPAGWLSHRSSATSRTCDVARLRLARQHERAEGTRRWPPPSPRSPAPPPSGALRSASPGGPRPTPPPPPAPQQNVRAPLRDISTGPPFVVAEGRARRRGLAVVAGEVARVVERHRLGGGRRGEPAGPHQLREKLGVMHRRDGGAARSPGRARSGRH